MKPNRHQAAKKKDDDYKKTSSESYVGKKEEAPEFMKFNKYIQRGYRINHNIKGILRSLFSVHN